MSFYFYFSQNFSKRFNINDDMVEHFLKDLYTEPYINLAEYGSGKAIIRTNAIVFISPENPIRLPKDKKQKLLESKEVNTNE